MFVGGTKPKLSSWNCCKKCKMCSSVSPAHRNVALQTQKGHLQYEMFHIHGTRWVQAGSRLHRTVSRQVLFVNREVLDFFVGPLVPCATTSPSLGLTKYASAYGRALRARTGETRRKKRNVWGTFTFSSSCVSPRSVSFSCVSRRFPPAFAYFVHPIIHEIILSRSSDCGEWREIPHSRHHLY